LKKQIGILTATRAEFGLLKPLIMRLQNEPFFDTRVLVTGMHLSPAFGNTYQEIEDAGGRYINARIDEYASKRDNVVAVTSLGVKRYLSAVRESCFVLGNSSSGIIEAPCLHIPTVNIGDRQKGRLMPDSVLCCEPKSEAIIKTIKKATSIDYRNSVKTMTNPFGNGKTSEKITEIIKAAFDKHEKISVTKKFYDIST